MMLTVGDKLPEKQLSLGYQMQSLFVGAGILLANGSIVLFQKLMGLGKSSWICSFVAL